MWKDDLNSPETIKNLHLTSSSGMEATRHDLPLHLVTAMTQNDISEEELLQRTGQGDARAFDRLYDALAPRMFGLLRQMLPDEREAEEALQDGFAQLWEQARTFDPSRSEAFAWSVMIFRGRAIERMRMLGRRNRLVGAGTLEQTTLGSTDAATVDSCATPVLAAFHGLTKDQRDLIGSAFLKGLTHHVIADSTGVSLEAVKITVRNGMQRLHDLLKGGND